MTGDFLDLMANLYFKLWRNAGEGTSRCPGNPIDRDPIGNRNQNEDSQTYQEGMVFPNGSRVNGSK